MKITNVLPLHESDCVICLITSPRSVVSDQNLDRNHIPAHHLL